MTTEKAIKIAKDIGYSIAEPLHPEKLEFRQEIRDMCSSDKCHNGFNKSWSCPPACVPLEDLTKKAEKYKAGILVQTICHMEDEYDYESVEETAMAHSKMFIRLADTLRDTGGDILPMGAGTCRRCEKCTYPGEPCRFPDKMFPSMEANGLFVTQVCQDNNLPYYYGPKTVAFTSCCLF